MLLLLIYAMSIHNYGVVVRFELFLKVLWKMGELMICARMVFDFMFDVVLIAFLSSQTYKQTLETNSSVSQSKLGILGEKWCELVIVHLEQGTVRLSELQWAPIVHFLEELRLSELQASSKRVLTGVRSLEVNGSLTTFVVLMFWASGTNPGGSKLILLM